MLRKIIIGVVILFLVAAGSFYYFQGTPRYSLYQIKKAVQSHDSLTFNKYVNVDRVADGLMEAAMKDFNDEMEKDDNPFGDIGQGIFQAMLPALKEQIKTSVNKGIEDISEDREGGSGKIDALKLKDIQQEGKSAKATLSNVGGDEIQISMVQTPSRYWQVVGIDLDDFKKINPDAMKSEDASASAEEPKDEIIIEKSIGEEVELATMKFKVVSSEEKQVIKKSYGETRADENTKFVVISMTVTNTTNEGFTFEEDDFALIDDKGRKFDAFGSIGSVDNYLDMRSLQPSIAELGMVIYKVPNDVSGYGIQIGKKDTNELYLVKLK